MLQNTNVLSIPSSVSVCGDIKFYLTSFTVVECAVKVSMLQSVFWCSKAVLHTLNYSVYSSPRETLYQEGLV